MATGRPAGRPRKIDPETAGIVRIPTAPTGKNAEWKKVWKRLWDEGREVLSLHDYTAVSELTQIIVDLNRRTKMLEEDEVPLYYESSNGTMASHPIFQQQKELRAQMNTLLAALGFTPSDRAKLGMMNAQTEDALDSYIENRQERDEERKSRRRRGGQPS